jgi:hypothetical protein
MSARTPTTEEIAEIFDAYITWAGKTDRYLLDEKRKRLIRNALRRYPKQDVVDAVRGWVKIPHNRGENAQGQVYNDLELLLRDSQHIERFRDALRETTIAKVVPIRSGASSALARSNAVIRAGVDAARAAGA